MASIAAILPANKPPSTITTKKKTSVALAQLALLGGVLLLKAHTNSIMKPTSGMHESSIVMSQSPRLTVGD